MPPFGMRNALLIAFLFSVPVLFGQVPVTDVYNLDSLSPQFKLVRVNIVEGKIDSSGGRRDTVWTAMETVIKHYSPDGRCTYAARTDQTGSINWHQEAKYNVENRTETFTGNDNRQFTRTAVSDDHGREVKNYYMLNAFTQDTNWNYYSYDSLGRLTRNDFYHHDHQSHNKTLYTYGANGLLKSRMFYRGIIEGDVWWLDSDSLYYYDNRSRLTGAAYHQYTKEGGLLFTDSLFMEHDEAGRTVKETWTRSTQRVYRTTESAYDSLGRITMLKRTYTFDYDTVVITERFWYDGKGYLVMRQRTDSQGTSVVKWVTQYDQQGYPLSALQVKGDKLYRYYWTYKNR